MLYEAVRDNLATLLAEAGELGRGLPRYVGRDFARYLECGVLAHGFARVRCETGWDARTPRTAGRRHHQSPGSAGECPPAVRCGAVQPRHQRVKAGLVESCIEWPGLTSLPRLLGPARRLFRWFNWTKRWGERRRQDMAAARGRFAKEWAEPVELEVERLRAVRALLREVEAEARAQGRPVLGARAVREQHPPTRPERLKRSPRPLGHASTRQAPRELREQYRATLLEFFDTHSGQASLGA